MDRIIIQHANGMDINCFEELLCDYWRASEASETLSGLFN